MGVVRGTRRKPLTKTGGACAFACEAAQLLRVRPQLLQAVNGEPERAGRTKLA